MSPLGPGPARMACAYCYRDQPTAAHYEFANGSYIRCDACWLRRFCWLPWWRVSA